MRERGRRWHEVVPGYIVAFCFLSAQYCGAAILRDTATKRKHTMNNAEYHAHRAVGSSQLKDILRSPAHFFAKHRAPDRIPFEPTPAMQFGTVVHAAILEPDTLASVVAVMPDDAPDKRSKDGKAWHEAFARESAGRIILSAERHSQAITIANVVRADPTCAALLADCDFERSGFWTDRATGVECKFRPDAIKRDCSIIVDVKTTADASAESFAKSIANFRYDLSAAHYIDGALQAFASQPHSFVFIAVETEPPFALACYRADTTVTSKGLHDRDRALRRYAECLADDVWPGYEPGIWPISLPKWARAFVEDRAE
jgi:exodeoxyribonuclease VIII